MATCKETDARTPQWICLPFPLSRIGHGATDGRRTADMKPEMTFNKNLTEKEKPKTWSEAFPAYDLRQYGSKEADASAGCKYVPFPQHLESAFHVFGIRKPGQMGLTGF